MDELIIRKYIDYLNVKFNQHKNEYNYFKTKRAFSNFQVFGSYGSSCKLINGKEKDIYKFMKRINVTASKNEIEKYYANNGIILLRPYKGENNLVIGCGNVIDYNGVMDQDSETYTDSDTDTDNIYDYEWFEVDDEYRETRLPEKVKPKIVKNKLISDYELSYDEEWLNLWIDFNVKHKHVSSYTINPDIEMNPSICCEFGNHTLESIPNESFENIIFEGFYSDPDKYPYWDTELLRLLKNGGYVWMNSDECQDSTAIYKKLNNKFVKVNKIKAFDF